MDRRTLLGTLPTAALAGCSVLSSDSFQRRTVRITATDSVPDDVPVTLAVRTIRPDAIPAHPARFELTLTYDGSETRELVWGPLPVANFMGIRSTPDSYILYHASDWGADDRQSNCWRQNEYAIGGGYASDELGPEDTISGEADLFDESEEGICWPTGTYRFERADAVVELDNEASDTTKYHFNWGFEFRVTAHS